LREELLDFDRSRFDWDALDLSEESSSAAEAIARLDRSKLEGESLPCGESAAGARATASCKQASAAAVTDKRLMIVMRSPPSKTLYSTSAANP
jgi:hypothetical protein